MLMQFPGERRFGVEIEFGFPGNRQTSNVRSLLDWENSDLPKRGWSITSDGSGVELRTPPLRGAKGFKKLHDMMELLKENGAFVTEADGMHVHHDAPEFVNDPRLCLKLVQTWRRNEAQIYEMVHPRRRGSGACPEWTDGAEQSLVNWVNGGHASLGRNDLNLSALNRHGTIEIRLHEGTLDPVVAKTWITFGQRIIWETLHTTNSLPQAKDHEHLLKRLHLTRKERRILAEKRAKEHITEGMEYIKLNSSKYREKRAAPNLGEELS